MFQYPVLSKPLLPEIFSTPYHRHGQQIKYIYGVRSIYQQNRGKQMPVYLTHTRVLCFAYPYAYTWCLPYTGLAVNPWPLQKTRLNHRQGRSGPFVKWSGRSADANMLRRWSDSNFWPRTVRSLQGCKPANSCGSYGELKWKALLGRGG